MNMSSFPQIETVVAVATPFGRGGIGVIRLSGGMAQKIGQEILQKELKARTIQYGSFYLEDGTTIDSGIALFFKGPHSFTGEDVVELQGHGSPVVLDMIVTRCIALGARMATPGEFSLRAFLNGRIDLTQAEAIADLIHASSTKAACLAIRTLNGTFSKKLNEIVSELTELRMYMEASIDFSEEDIEWMENTQIMERIETIKNNLMLLSHQAAKGTVIQEGLKVVIAGAPNVGKSSLINALAEKECAIESPIPGTTRDVIREYIQINGVPIHIVDTAGIRDNPDEIERLGIERAKKEIDESDVILWLVDAKDTLPIEEDPVFSAFKNRRKEGQRVFLIRNKIDLLNEIPRVDILEDNIIVSLSAKTSAGIDLLRAQLIQLTGIETTEEGLFSARRRHLIAIEKAVQAIHQADHLIKASAYLEIIAEELRIAQNALGEITGTVTTDDLLGQIFSTFCVGK